MKQYRVNEIFYSLQGEGRWAGTAAIFVRFSGCNLRCPFCDTDFSKSYIMTADDIIAKMKEVGGQCHFMVFTGGEPSLQLDNQLIEMLHQEGYYISVETNGTHPLPLGVDWITCSPKVEYVTNGKPQLTRASEVKVIFDGRHNVSDYGIQAEEYFIQPCDTGDSERNIQIVQEILEFVKANPKWRLSLQEQKLLSIR